MAMGTKKHLERQEELWYGSEGAESPGHPFEGIDSERGIAWRVSDSLSVRDLLGYGIDESTPDHVTISRARRLIDAETHQKCRHSKKPVA
jgi:hypothetical protein